MAKNKEPEEGPSFKGDVLLSLSQLYRLVIMKRYLTVVLGVLLALLSTASCGKQGGEEENLDTLSMLCCTNNATGIDWTLTFSQGMHFSFTGKTSTGQFKSHGTYTFSDSRRSKIEFSNNRINIPADASPSGQNEQYTFPKGTKHEQVYNITCIQTLGDGDRNTVNLTFQ